MSHACSHIKGDTFERDFGEWDVKNASWVRRRLTEVEAKFGGGGRLPPALDRQSQVSEESEDACTKYGLYGTLRKD